MKCRGLGSWLSSEEVLKSWMEEAMFRDVSMGMVSSCAGVWLCGPRWVVIR